MRTQFRPHIWRCDAFYSLIVNPFIDNIPVFLIPLIESFAKTLLISFRDDVYQAQQLLRGLYIRILSQIPPDNKHLMELTHLYRYRLQCQREPLHAVNHNTVYSEAIVLQPLYILGYRLMSYIFMS